MKMKRKIIKKIELVFTSLSAVTFMLGSALIVALIFLGPFINERIYYILLTSGIGGMTLGLLVYVFIFGELEAFISKDGNGTQNK